MLRDKNKELNSTINSLLARINLDLSMKSFIDALLNIHDSAYINNSLIDNLSLQQKKLVTTLIGNNLKTPPYWEIASLLGAHYNRNSLSEAEIMTCKDLIKAVREYQGFRAKSSKAASKVIFGTSGWRGVIGEDFTLLNVHKVIRGIIDMMKSDLFLKENNCRAFSNVREKGVVVCRDNRYMGDDFMDAAMKELSGEGIIIYNAGECPTGVASAIVTELQAAGSINFTPSHNPMEYAGIKFNPSDGGPADKTLTLIIEENADKYMSDNSFIPARLNYTAINIDAKKIYKNYIEKNIIFERLETLTDWLLENKHDLSLIIDNMHGSTRGYIEYLLGNNIVSELTKARAVKFINTEDDYSFHGIKPEPSAANMETLEALSLNSKRRLCSIFALDPDGDRVRFGKDLDMNRFAPIAFEYLLQKGFNGGVATTIVSSSFADIIAERNNQQVSKTKVGFKELRPFNTALVKFEESDGISFKDHTKEKDGIAGLLLALSIIKYYNKSLPEVFEALQKKYGYYYPNKSGIEVKGISMANWQEYSAKVIIELGKLIKPGDRVKIGSLDISVKTISTLDGVKYVFSDNSSISLRKSGTEPKFRNYWEITSNKALTGEDLALKDKDYSNTGLILLEKGRSIIDNQ